ncbi:hypothetical protein LH19_11690 [Sphingopyxis macrogoltabida]|nr:hypothetical protein LH19_11690 [Sphingopyxis macrogoltabida]
MDLATRRADGALPAAARAGLISIITIFAPWTLKFAMQKWLSPTLIGVSCGCLILQSALCLRRSDRC